MGKARAATAAVVTGLVSVPANNATQTFVLPGTFLPGTATIVPEQLETNVTDLLERPRHAHPFLTSRLYGAPLMLERRSLDRLLALSVPRMQLEPERQLRTFGYFNAGGVAVLPIFGAVMKRGTGSDWLDEWLGVVSVEKLQQTFKSALADPGVESILLQLDSPGGETCGIFDVADAIFAARGTKPIWAIADEWAFSAGYLLASAADRVVLPRTGGVGSIGCYGVRVDETGLDAQLGVAWHIVEFGARKADGHPHKATTDAELTDLQAEVDRLGEMFVAAVARNRGLSPKAIRGTEARTFHGDAATAIGLADAIGTFEDTVMELATAPRAGQSGGQRMSTEAKGPVGGEVIQLAEHRAAVDAAKKEASVEERARIATITNQCVAAKRSDLIATFVGDPTATIESVAKMLADAAVAADGEEIKNQQKPAGDKPPTINVAAIYAHRREQVQQAQARRQAQRQ